MFQLFFSEVFNYIHQVDDESPMAYEYEVPPSVQSQNDEIFDDNVNEEAIESEEETEPETDLQQAAEIEADGSDENGGEMIKTRSKRMCKSSAISKMRRLDF